MLLLCRCCTDPSSTTWMNFPHAFQVMGEMGVKKIDLEPGLAATVKTGS